MTKNFQIFFKVSREELNSSDMEKKIKISQKKTLENCGPEKYVTIRLIHFNNKLGKGKKLNQKQYCRRLELCNNSFRFS